jgi:hypothetical protein
MARLGAFCCGPLLRGKDDSISLNSVALGRIHPKVGAPAKRRARLLGRHLVVGIGGVEGPRLAMVNREQRGISRRIDVNRPAGSAAYPCRCPGRIGGQSAGQGLPPSARLRGPVLRGPRGHARLPAGRPPHSDPTDGLRDGVEVQGHRPRRCSARSSDAPRPRAAATRLRVPSSRMRALRARALDRCAGS